MSQAQATSGEPAVRASDAERDQTADVLRAGYAEGRLTRAELDERIDAAYAAKTRADLRDLTTDLPGAAPAEAAADGHPPVVDSGTGASAHLNLCLLLCLLCAFPPAGIAYGIYWILTARGWRQPISHEPSLPAGARGRAVSQPPRMAGD
jgi:hypothetical protein